MQRRLVRAVTWGVLAAAGIVAGLAAGSSLADAPLDGQMLTQLGAGAGGLAAVLGLALPMKRRPS